MSLEELAVEEDAMRATIAKMKAAGSDPAAITRCEGLLAKNGLGRARIEEMRDGILRMMEGQSGRIPDGLGSTR